VDYIVVLAPVIKKGNVLDAIPMKKPPGAKFAPVIYKRESQVVPNVTNIRKSMIVKNSITSFQEPLDWF
jgi:hypothetical protein